MKYPAFSFLSLSFPFLFSHNRKLAFWSKCQEYEKGTASVPSGEGDKGGLVFSFVLHLFFLFCHLTQTLPWSPSAFTAYRTRDFPSGEGKRGIVWMREE